MLLKYNEDHKSIKSFSDIEVSNFSIFTGINGSGKTQLLEAILNGKIQVEGIRANEIAYFDSTNFQIPKEQTISTENIKREKLALWQNFITKPANRPSPKETFNQIKTSSIPNHVKTFEKISNEKNKPVLLLKWEDLDNNQDIFNELEKYQQGIDVLKSRNQTDVRIIEFAFNYNGFIDNITQKEFMEKISVYTSVNNFFAQQISHIFVNFNNLCTLEYAKLLKQNESSEITPITYKKEAVRIVLKKYGGEYPWDYINDLFESFNDFNYKITKPDEFELEDLDDTQSKQFTATLYNEKKNLTINFDELSSGEKTLLAMALMMFNTVLTKHFPKLVLLDEIDSTLHPSMTEDLLLALRNIFTNNGINVMLVTHSPSTVAFAQKDSIYLVNSTSKEFIEKTDPQTALGILTQGYMTLKDSNVIFDAINNYDLTIFSEGNNVDYIRTAINLHQKDKATKVNVWNGIEGKTSVGQLEMLYHLFNSVNLTKKILIVFDPDVTLKVHTNEEKLIFVTKLESVENSYATSGVESVLPDLAFEGFLINVEDELRGNVTKSFPDKNKTPLGKKLNSEQNPDVFKNFKPLTDHILEILGN